MKKLILATLSIIILAAVFHYKFLYKPSESIYKNEVTRVKSLKIVTTTGMIADAVRNIGMDKVEVISLMGPGVDPHMYKSTPGDYRALQKADLIFYNGLHLEGKMGDVLKSLSLKKPTYAVGDALDNSDLITDEDFTEGVDPHFWFDVKLWIKAVNYIKETLVVQDPRNSKFYEANYLMYLESLENLDVYIRDRLKKIPKEQKILITAHDAFGYWGRAYNMDVKGLQGISTASDYGLNDVAELVNVIICRKVKAIFIETSVPAKPIKAVIDSCASKGHNVILGGPLFSDAMGPKGTFEGTYIGMLKTNTNIMVAGLLKGIQTAEV